MLERFTHRPGEGLKEAIYGWTYDGEIVPEEIWRSIDSTEEELSEETELAFVRYWMEHEPGRSSRYDRWYDLWEEHHQLESRLKHLEESRSSSAARLEMASIDGKLQAIRRDMHWLDEGMTAVLEGEPLPPEPAKPDSVKVADLFGNITDTHVTEAQLRNPLAPRRSR